MPLDRKQEAAERARVASLSDEDLAAEFQVSSTVSTAMMSTARAAAHVRQHNLLAAEHARRTASQRLHLKTDGEGVHLSNINTDSDPGPQAA